MRYISRFKNSIRASSVYSLAFMLTFALAAGLTTYEEAAAQPSVKLTIEAGDPTSVMEDDASSPQVTVIATLSSLLQSNASVTLRLSGSAIRKVGENENDYDVTSGDLTFPISGSLTGQTTLTIDPFEDNVFEGDRDIVITGTVTTEINGVTTSLFVESDLKFTILDDDFDIMLSITGPMDDMDMPVITESSDTLSVTVEGAFDSERIRVLGAPVTVLLNVAPHARYTVLGSPMLEISAGQTSGTGTVMFVVENDESHTPPQTIEIGGTAGGYSVQSTRTLMLLDNDSPPTSLVLTVDKTQLPEEGGAQRVTVTATFIGNNTFAASTDVALTLMSDPEAGDATYSVAEEDPKVTIRPGMSSGSTTVTIRPVNNAIHGEDIEIMVDGSVGTTIMADEVTDATITILNDDFDGTLVAAPSTLSEGDDEREVMVTVTLPRSTDDMDREVTLAVSGSAVSGTDYMVPTGADAANPTTVTVDAGATTATATFKFDPEDDSGYEGDETIVISGMSVSGELNLKPATVTLLDGDAEPTVALSFDEDSAKDVEEGTSGEVVVTATLSSTLAVEATVTLSLSGNADDYTAVDAQSLMIRIAGGVSSGDATFDIATTADIVFEGNEEIVISGTAMATLGGGPKNLVVTSDDLVFTILDDDFDIMLSITDPLDDMDMPVITESSDTLSVTVEGAFDSERIRVLGAPVTVLLNVAPHARYTVLGSPMLEISAGQTSGTGTVMFVVENDESHTPPQTIEIGGTAGGYSVQSTRTLMLLDNDSPPTSLVLTVDKTQLPEEDGAQRVTVTATFIGNNTFAASTDVALTLMSDPEAGDATYSVAEEDPKVTIRPGMSSGSTTVTIRPVNNAIHGEDIEIMVDGSVGTTIMADEVTDATITILNDDFDGTLVAAPSTLSEGDDEREVMVTVTLPRSTDDMDREVTLAVSGSAVSGTDYMVPTGADAANPTTVTVDAGATTATATFKFDPEDDSGYEGDETIVISGMSVSGELNLKPATVTLLDGDAEPTVALSFDEDSAKDVEEGTSGEVVVTATLSSTLAVEATVTLSLSGNADDYTAVDAQSLMIRIAGGVSSGDATFDIATTADIVFEGNEEIVISGTAMATLGGGPKNLVVTSDDLVFTILDDDFDIMLSITDPLDDMDMPVIPESSDTLSVTVEGAFDSARITVLGAPVTVLLNVAPHARYTVLGSPMLEISAGQTSGTGTVMFVVENDESHTPPQTIEIGGTAGGYSVQSTRTLMLLDNDSPPTSLVLTVDKTQLPEEDGAQRVTITATFIGNNTFAASTDVALTLMSDPEAGDATYSVAEEDPKVTIRPGMSSGSTTVTIRPVNNAIHGEDIEIMVDGSVGTTIMADEVFDATITILNDDFDGTLVAAPSTLSEGDGEREVMVTVTLPRSASTMDREVTLAVSGTAVSGTDYMVPTGADAANPTTVTVDAGATKATATFKFDPEDDSGYEGDETIVISGMSVSGELNLKPATVTLLDGDAEPTVALSFDEDSAKDVEEGTSGEVVVTATLSSTLAVEATVTLSLSGNADDYTAVDAQSLMIRIAGGVSSGDATFDIATTADIVFEGNEEIVISGTAMATLGGGPKNLVVTSDDLVFTILDDDYDISLSAMPMTIVESSDTLSVTVLGMFSEGRISSLASPVVISLDVAAHARYKVLGSPSLEISAGQTSGTGTVMFVIDNDESHTPPQTIEIRGTSAAGYSVQSTGDFMLIDDDEAPITVRLTVDDSELREEGGAQRVTITATFIGDDTFAASKDVALTLMSDPEAGDATYSVAEEDPKVTIGPGMSSGSTTVTITPVNNVIYGEDIEITIVGISSNVTVSNAMVTIFNDDFDGVLTVSPSMLSEKDGVREVMVTATLPPSSATTARTIALTMGIAGTTERASTTTDNADYAADTDNPESIVIEAGSTSATVTLKIDPIDDGLFEGEETILIIGEIADVDIEIKSASILLRDAQRAMITLTVDIEEILEAGGQPVEVTVTATQSTKITTPTVISLAKSGIAEKEVDYIVEGDGEITIDAAATVGITVLTITPVDDFIFEDEDGETIIIGGSTPDNYVVHPATIALIDNNLIPLEYVMVEPNMLAEDDSTGTEVLITVKLMGTSGYDLMVGLDKSMGTAKPGDDFTVMAASDEFMIPAGDSTAVKTVTLTPINDEEIEGEEEILVEAWTMDMDGMRIGDLVYTGIVLTDDDSIVDLPLVALSVDNMTFVEGVDQSLTITATANGTVPVPQVIALLPVPDHTTIDLADAPALFTKFAAGVTITILPNELTGQMVIPITTVDDMVFEGDEVAVIIGTVVATESNTNPVQIILADNDAPAVTLTTSSATLSESGGAQSVTFTAEMTSGAVESPTMIHLSVVDGTASSADYSSAGGMITIPAGMTSGSADVTISVMADEVYEPSNETVIVSAGYRTHVGLANVPLTITDDFAAPAVVSGLPSISIEAGESWTGDVASSFTGMALTYSASSSGDAASADISGSALSISGDRKGSARVTVTAMNAAGNASFEMDVSVTAIAAEQMVYTDILAAMGRNVMSSVSQTIGGRFSVGAAERQIALANRRVDGMASGMQTLINLSGMQETNKYGITDENSGRYNRQRVSERELLQGSSFYYAFDDTPDNHMDAGLSFTIWGAGDWNAFEGAPTASSSYDGTLTSGYVGVDVSKTASWIAGVAVGRTMGSADYDVSVTDGTLETTLNSVYPYVHWTGPGCCIEVWAVGGFGTGEAEANEMTSDLSMSLGMVGLRAQLVGGASGSLDLDLIGDAGITKLTTGEGSASLDDLEASVQRARIGLEASRTSDMGNGMLVTPFAQIAGRYDGGDGQSGNGLEVAGGLRIAGGRAGLEARGRYLAIHTGEEVKEQGVSVVAYVRPMGAGGQGLSMSLAPRMGADTEMSNNMWREDSRSDVRLTSRSGAAVKAEIGYGLVHPMMSSLLVTPFGTMDMAGRRPTPHAPWRTVRFHRRHDQRTEFRASRRAHPAQWQHR